MLDIKVISEGNFPTIKIKGELDIATADSFKEAVVKAKTGASLVIIDFAELEFLDSTGVGALLQVIKGIQEDGNSIKVCNISKDIFEVLDLLGIPELVGEDSFELLN